MLDQGLLALIGVIVVIASSTFVRFYYISWIGERVVADIRAAVFNHILKLSPGFFETTKTGEILSRLTAKVDWVWIVGNHDPGFSDHCGGTIQKECEVGGIVLRHEAKGNEVRPEMSGHFHPKFRMSLRGRNVSRRCFVASATKLILPAYGAFTGGLDAGHPEIVRKVGRGASALVPVTNRLLKFPIAA